MWRALSICPYLLDPALNSGDETQDSSKESSPYALVQSLDRLAKRMKEMKDVPLKVGRCRLTPGRKLRPLKVSLSFSLCTVMTVTAALIIPFGDLNYRVDSNQLKRYEPHMSPRHPVKSATSLTPHSRGPGHKPVEAKAL
jgi:hypothetical protein